MSKIHVRRVSHAGSVVRKGFVGGTPGNRPSAFDPSVELAPSEIAEDTEHVDTDWLYRTAIEARRNPTNAERRLWGALTRRGIADRFTRQRVFGPYYVDLYCPQREAIIEVDGRRGHSTDAERAKDTRRDAYFAARGILVIRVTNAEVNADAYALADHIAVQLHLSPSPKPHPDSATNATAWLD